MYLSKIPSPIVPTPKTTQEEEVTFAITVPRKDLDRLVNFLNAAGFDNMGEPLFTRSEVIQEALELWFEAQGEV